MFREYSVSFAEYNDWKLPFNFAVGLHIALIFGVVYFPEVFRDKPRFEDIYTVDLINIEAPAPPQQAPAPTPPPQETPAREIKAVEAKKTAPILEPEPAPPAQPEVAKPVSIKPLKRKIKKERVETVSAAERKRLEKIAKQRAEEARRAEQMAEEAAKLAASEAVNQLKELLRQSPVAAAEPNDIPPPRPAARGSSGQQRNVLENQYYASIFSKIQPHWKLPEHKMREKDLSATIVIRVARDGSITQQFFEQRSGDMLFDQFVLKALQDAAPLPPIPGALQKDSFEIGLKFKPGSIQY